MVLAPTREPYIAYGEGCKLFDWLDGSDPNVPEEVLFEGVVGSGKTRLMCEWVAAACNRFPTSKGLILRSTRTSLSDSVLPTLEEEVLGLDHPALLSGGSRETREFYRHPTLGGEIRLGGFNHYEKLYSTQYDWVWWAEVVDKLSNEDAFQRFHRCLRRGAMPFSLLLSDGNPGDQFHWRNLRAEALQASGVSARLCGRFHDNPRWYDHERGVWTAEGVRYLRKLKRTLSGPALDQFFYGRWTVASGLVWPEYDRATHEIDAEVIKESDGVWWLEVESWPSAGPIEIKWFFGAQDVGHTAPGCAQVWGVDKENRAYRVVEIYRRGWNHKEWSDRWAELDEEFDLEAIACDHDPAFIEAINDKLDKNVRGVPIAREWDKHRGPRGAKAGIDEVRVRLKRQDDGRRGLYLLKNAVRYQDMELVRDRLPWKTEMELPGYILRDVKGPGGRMLAPEAAEDPDKRCTDHGCFEAGTLVATPCGSVPIEHVRPGSLVETSNGPRRVEAAMRTGTRDLWELRTVSGRRVVGTGDHPIWSDGEWIRLDTMRAGAMLAAWRDRPGLESTRPNLSSSTASSGGATRRVRSGLIAATSRGACDAADGPSTCTVTSTRSTTDRFLRAGSCITETAILATMTRRTSFSSRPASTRGSIRFPKSDARDLPRTSTRIDISRARGTDLRRGAHGTARTPEVSRHGLDSIEHATSAERSTRQPGSTRRSSADRSAKSARGPIVLDEVLSVRPLGRSAPVFNLTVEGEHVYFAGGVLVSNCDTMRGAMTYLRDHEGTYAEEKLAFPRGSVNDQLGLNKWFRERGMI